MQSAIRENLAEKWANVITHAIGVLLSICALTFFLIQEYHFVKFTLEVSLILFALTLIFVYLASTFYHLSDIYFPRWRTSLKRIDHISIYTLIAGSQTPIVIQYLERPICLIYLSLLWVLVFLGVLYKVFFLGKFKKLSVGIYLGLGWLFIIVLPFMYATMKSGVLLWIIIGGVAYSSGVVFYLWEKLKFNHSIWHLFVIAGSAAHFVAVYLAVLIQ